MKLLSHDSDQFVFLIGKRERQMMLNLLRQYPVLSVPYHQIHRGQLDAREKEHQELLREAMAEQQKENKRLLEEMIGAEGRFVEDQLGYRFTLKASEAEWMLQVLNDVRVGSWVKLGSPKLTSSPAIPLNEANVKLCWAMEIAGLFQSELLHALETGGT